MTQKMINGYPVLDTCPAPIHNSLRAVRKTTPACHCPGAEARHDEYLSAQRRKYAAQRKAIAEEIYERMTLKGEAASRLLTRQYDMPPHLCISEGWDPDLWFSPVPAEQDQARAICGRCPMRRTCEQAALDNGVQGVWGGSDEDDRRLVRNSWTQAS
jgi:WhiB family redox-sensing transcriptional regulator